MKPAAPTPPATVDTLGYVRVSTESQAGEHNTSLPEQRRAIVTRAAQLGRVVDPRALFEDPGVSGATAEGRPGFMAMLAFAQANPRPDADGVILVLNDSRFGRFDDPEEATHWRFVLKKLGWMVRFCEGDDLEDGIARGVLRFIGSAQASEYRANLKRTAKRATRATAEKGRWQNRAPYGYRRLVTRADGAQRTLERGQRKADDEITRLALGPELEQAAVKFAFEQYATGRGSMLELLRQLKAQFPSKPWRLGTLNAMLKNPAYMGDIVWCRRPADKNERRRGRIRPREEWVVVTDAHPALVSRDVFAQVQARLASNKKETRATAGGYPLSGFIRCTSCNHTYVGGGGKRGPADDPDKHRFYRDGAAYKTPNPCPGKIITLSKRWLEPIVVGAVAEVVKNPRVQTVIAEELDRALDVAGGGTAGRAADLERERQTIIEKRQRVVDAIANQTLTDREAAKTLAELRARVEAIDAELERLRFAVRRLDGVSALREKLMAMAADFEATALRASGAALRELLRPWIADATLNKESRILTLVIRRVPDVFGAPWGTPTVERQHAVAGARPSVLNSTSRARKTGETTPDRRLVVVRRIKIPTAPRDSAHCKRGHPLSGDNLYRTPDNRRECKTCRRARERASTKRGQEKGMAEAFRTRGKRRAGGAR